MTAGTRGRAVEQSGIKIARRHTLVEVDPYPSKSRALQEIERAIAGVRWPPGADGFTIHAESGRARGQGSGVRPIRDAFVIELAKSHWASEASFPLPKVPGGSGFGDMDAAKAFDLEPPFMVEWETGNISSSHRSMNKIALGLKEGVIAGGVVIVPTRALAKYLTDRIGNEQELEPYFPFWRAVQVKRGYLGVIAVEHDAASVDVPRIVKGTDGRALT
jgi:hypothetical protein